MDDPVYVYIVWHSDYEQSGVVSVFSTEEAARDAAGERYEVVRWRLDDPEHFGDWLDA